MADQSQAGGAAPAQATADPAAVAGAGAAAAAAAAAYPQGQYQYGQPVPAGYEQQYAQYAAYAAQQQQQQAQYGAVGQMSYQGAQQPQNPYLGTGADGKRAHLYVGNLSPRVTEYMLQEIFSVAGQVQGVKIIPDRNFQHGGLNYGFVEYYEMRSAETAMQTLSGRKIFDTEIRVNWAYQNTANTVKEDLSNHFHVFVGDLSPEVNDDVLAKAFSAFGSLSDARVMWDMNSGKSRGYGFLAFRDKTDAEQAIATMNGEWLGSRAIRVNWANQKNAGMPGAPPGGGGAAGGMAGGGGGGMRMGGGGGVGFGGGPQSYEAVVAMTPSYNSTVYTGNLVPYCTQADLIPLFQGFGYIVEIRMQADRGFAFVKLDTHENAAMAIVNLTGTPVHGRPLKCSWGKDRASADPNAVATPGVGMAPYMGQPQPQQQQQMYGMPQAYGMQAQYPGYPQYGAQGYPQQAYAQPGADGQQAQPQPSS